MMWAIVCEPADYAPVIDELKRLGNLTLDTKRRLAGKAFAHTARYDAVIASYFRERSEDKDIFPQEMTIGLKKIQNLRYGENPHQKAALYQETGARIGRLGRGDGQTAAGERTFVQQLSRSRIVVESGERIPADRGGDREAQHALRRGGGG